MKNIIRLLILLLSVSACRQEENLTPSYARNPFAPNEKDMDGESVMRRNFYSSTGCYLLFNDTLYHEYRGLNVYGQPYYETEVVGLEWNMTSVNSSRFSFDYIESLQQKQQVTEFLKTYLIPYVKTILPYSILVVENINKYDKVTGKYEYKYVASPLTYSNMRCLALGIKEIWELAETEYLSYAQDICCEMIFASWGGDPQNDYEGSKAEDFLFPNLFDYGSDKEDYDIPFGLGTDNIEDFYELGFLVNTNEIYLPSAAEDAASYIKLCLLMTETEVRTRFADYPTILEKYDLIKPLVDETNIQF